MAVAPKALYQSDSLALLERIESEQVTLAYLDPPWYSEMQSGGSSTGVSDDAEASLEHYLAFIGSVLQQVRRVLRARGTVFFQIEPGLSPYVRLLHDRVFGRKNFRYEYVLRNPRLRSGRRSWAAGHETLLHYGRSPESIYHPPTRQMTAEELRTGFETDSRGPYRLVDITAPGVLPDHDFSFLGVEPPRGRHWRYSEDQMARMSEAGELVSRSGGGRLARKLYMDAEAEIEVGTVWDDMSPYQESRKGAVIPSQRRLDLLKRVVRIGSNNGDTVLDPFCGSGTAVIAAEEEARGWIACDISGTAVSVSEQRLANQCGLQPKSDYQSGTQELLEADHARVYSSYDDVSKFIVRQQLAFRYGKPLPIEETRHIEFKEVRGNNPANSIRDATDQYVVAFLNSEGGRIYWGVNDQRVVVGVRLTHNERDNIRRVVTERITGIQPPIAPTSYRIEFHPVEGAPNSTNQFVVELVVPRADPSQLYWTSKSEAYVRTDAGKKKLNVQEIREEILKRQHR